VITSEREVKRKDYQLV